MRRVACIAAGAALSASFNASALGSLARVSLIDRDTGAAIAAHYFHGEYWVAGAPGARYGIEIRNLSGGRLLAVTSVDGVNVLSGDTAAWNQSGYVFDPGERYQINGWRKSNSEVAGFTFTAADDSYAQRTGRPANVGVIGVALFREREAAAYSPPRIAESPYAPPPSPLVGGMPSAAAPAAADRARASSAESVVTSPKLGTGHGEREYSYVTDTQFQRLQSEPNEVIRIRYDSYENLVALGVIRAPRPRPPLPEPFPDSQGRQFVPDPPG